MKSQEKIIEAITLMLVEKYGDEFLDASEDIKNNLICSTLLNYFDSIKTKA